jgi:hypothetical protein
MRRRLIKKIYIYLVGEESVRREKDISPNPIPARYS